MRRLLALADIGGLEKRRAFLSIEEPAEQLDFCRRAFFREARDSCWNSLRSVLAAEDKDSIASADLRCTSILTSDD